LGIQIRGIDPEAMHLLLRHRWPGNVRELEHVIERAVITSSGPVFRVSDRLENESVELRENPIKDLAAMERDHIVKALEKTQWKIDGDGGAASLLGLHPSTLRYRLKKLGVKRP
jgi:transcriptional regulator with GAF, ATPase, and Fis domain